MGVIKDGNHLFMPDHTLICRNCNDGDCTKCINHTEKVDACQHKHTHEEFYGIQPTPEPDPIDSMDSREILEHLKERIDLFVPSPYDTGCIHEQDAYERLADDIKDEINSLIERLNDS